MFQLTLPALVALFAFPLAAFTAFVIMPLRRAILTTYLVGWMFLPQGQLPVEGWLPDYDRSLAIAVGVLGALVLFDAGRLMRFRPGWIDVPVALFLAVPFASSMSNGLGAYDGVSETLARILTIAPPYLLGRIYFADREGLRQLAIAVFVGGLCLAPLCVVEMRLSPQFHAWVYGAHQHSFIQTQRLGGYRPMVFMQHGLAAAMWMAAATLAGAWLLRARVLRSPAWLLLVPAVALTTVFCRSLGALGLLSLGLVVLAGSRATRRAAPLLMLLAVAPLYVAVRGSGSSDGSTPIAVARELVPADRAQSLAFRLETENLLVQKAQQRPVLGWAGWARSQITSRAGEKLSVTDGMWIIVFGQNGVCGLLLYLLYSALPLVLFARTVPARYWLRPEVAPAAVLVVLCGLYTVDNLLNAMFNPLATMALGGVAGLMRHRRLALLQLFGPTKFRASGEPSATSRAPAVAHQRTFHREAVGPRVATIGRGAPRRGAHEEETA